MLPSLRWLPFLIALAATDCDALTIFYNIVMPDGMLKYAEPLRHQSSYGNLNDLKNEVATAQLSTIHGHPTVKFAEDVLISASGVPGTYRSHQTKQHGARVMLSDDGTKRYFYFFLEQSEGADGNIKVRDFPNMHDVPEKEQEGKLAFWFAECNMKAGTVDAGYIRLYINDETAEMNISGFRKLRTMHKGKPVLVYRKRDFHGTVWTHLEGKLKDWGYIYCFLKEEDVFRATKTTKAPLYLPLGATQDDSESAEDVEDEGKPLSGSKRQRRSDHKAGPSTKMPRTEAGPSTNKPGTEAGKRLPAILQPFNTPLSLHKHALTYDIILIHGDAEARPTVTGGVLMEFVVGENHLLPILLEKAHEFIELASEALTNCKKNSNPIDLVSIEKLRLHSPDMASFITEVVSTQAMDSVDLGALATVGTLDEARNRYNTLASHLGPERGSFQCKTTVVKELINTGVEHSTVANEILSGEYFYRIMLDCRKEANEAAAGGS